MNHNQHPDGLQLMAFFDGELSPEETTRVQEHCQTCPECRHELESFGEVQNVIKADDDQSKPKPVWPFVASQLEEKQSKQFTPSFVFGTAAACAAGIAMGLLMGAPMDNSQVSQTSQTSQENSSWTTADFLWSGTDSPTLFTVFSESKTQERSSES